MASNEPLIDALWPLLAISSFAQRDYSRRDASHRDAIGNVFGRKIGHLACTNLHQQYGNGMSYRSPHELLSPAFEHFVVEHCHGHELVKLAMTLFKWFAGATRAWSVLQWVGILAPAGTSKDTIARLNSALRHILGRRDIVSKLAAQGMTATASSPVEFQTLISAEIQEWKDVAQKACNFAQVAGRLAAIIRNGIRQNISIWPLSEQQ